jgi:hypothetical protein
MTKLATPTACSTVPIQIIACPLLPSFDVGHFYDVQMAFSSAVSMKLGQAWRRQPVPNFSPARVCVGWRYKSILIYAELIDLDIFTSASVVNQRLWELGDTFEIFLKPATVPGCVKLQVAPNNLHLQLRLPHVRAIKNLRRDGLAQYLMGEETFHSKSWVHSNGNRWYIYIEVPAKILCEPVESLAGQQWQFSFGRYDHNRNGREPVISSTSPHAQPDFHRHKEWGVLIFVTSI